MNVLFATVEMYPLAKVGGLGDVAGSLPKALKALGIDIRIAMPYHGSIHADAKKIGNLRIRDEIYEVYETSVENLTVYLLRNDFLSREKVYGFEDPLRWARFSEAVVHLPEFLGWNVDIIHGNDWMTSLIPYYARRDKIKVKFMLTIHNLRHQGKLPPEEFDKLHLSKDFMDDLLWNGEINYMKAGIISADAVNTVSPTYAREIMGSEFGEGLERILGENREKIHGILNGIDYEVWNPERDAMIPYTYSSENMEGKRKNRRYLAEMLGIEEDAPIIGFVARLVEQKGLDIMLEALKEIAGAHFVILGTGRERYERALKEMEGKWVHPLIKYDEKLAHLIYASSDMFLMPSRFEPCGLGQMIALRYGSVPIVRKTGGLADTVKDVSEGGWGFVFEDYTPTALRDAIERAIDTYHHGNWDEIVRRAMSLDFSWKRSARGYARIYSSIL